MTSSRTPARYDLDLSYITQSIIAMGFPAEGTEGLYRNNHIDVLNFMEDFHRHRYKVYNLCSERTVRVFRQKFTLEDAIGSYWSEHACGQWHSSRKFHSLTGSHCKLRRNTEGAYSADRFQNRVALFPFDDHGPPTLQVLEDFCINSARWLALHPQNTVAVHCKAGKGRSGCVIACLLMHLRLCGTAPEALDLFAARRCSDAAGVTIPSQIRYVEHYERLLAVPTRMVLVFVHAIFHSRAAIGFHAFVSLEANMRVTNSISLGRPRSYSWYCKLRRNTEGPGAC
jgi:phosphatidylinositol-3,4,5-trisphosphate 3-phosphatase/dual-specificity protein phosphatase PTEN